MALLVKSVNPTASLGDQALGCRGEECRAHGAETSRAVPVPTLAKVYEDRAEDCTRCVCRKPRPFDPVKESRNVGHNGRAALLPFEAVGFAVQVNQPA